MIVEFAKAVALLLALCLLQGFIVRRWPREPVGRVLSGLLFGGICVIGMNAPIEVSPGVIFDARSVVLSMSGLFGGPVVGLVAGVVAGGYRAWLGGAGAPVGVAVIASSVLLGLGYWHGRRHGRVRVNLLNLLVFGLLVHLAEVLLFTFLPEGVVTRVLDRVALPLIVTFTPATALLGMLLQSVERQVEIGNSLAESEVRFRDIAEVSGDWIWEMDADLRFVYLSPRFFEIFSFEAGDILGRTRAAFAHAALDDHWRAHIETLGRREPFRDFEYPVADPDGRTRHIRISGKPVFDADGAFRGYRGTGTDVTAVTEAEEQADRTRQLLYALADNFPALISLKDQDGRFQFVNRVWEEWVCRKREDVVGKTLRDVYGPEEAAGFEASDADIVEKAEALTLELDVDYPDGVTRSVISTRFPVFSSDGRIVGLGRINYDVSERRRMERMKDEFISMVSHELRTPLTSIVGALGLLLRGTLDATPDKAAEMVDVAYKNANRLSGLVDDLLEAQKIQFEDTRFDFRTLKLSDIVEKAIDANRPYAASFGVSIVLTDALPGTVSGDSGRLEQVMANLLSNAVKFSPRGGEVAVSVTRAGGRLRVSVRDHGCGVPAAFREHLFDRFTQADSSATRMVGGSGLGLFISKAIIERHGGDIGFETVTEAEAGRGGETGSTFHFDLPEKTV